MPWVRSDPDVDAVIVLVTATAVADPDEVLAALAAATAADARKTVLAVVTGGAATTATSALPCFAYPEAAASVLGRVAERAEWLRRPIGRVQDADVDRAAADTIVAAALADAGEGWLGPEATSALLTAYGIPTAAQRVAHTESEALAAAAALGFPVVVKTGSAGAHKTERGGVVLDVRTPAELAAATAIVGFPAVIQPLVRGGARSWRAWCRMRCSGRSWRSGWAARWQSSWARCGLHPRRSRMSTPTSWSRPARLGGSWPACAGQRRRYGGARGARPAAGPARHRPPPDRRARPQPDRRTPGRLRRGRCPDPRERFDRCGGTQNMVTQPEGTAIMSIHRHNRSSTASSAAWTARTRAGKRSPRWPGSPTSQAGCSSAASGTPARAISLGWSPPICRHRLVPQGRAHRGG